jgi:hypothetical protein
VIFARVELHERTDAKPNYEVLKKNMARWKFSHELWDGSNFALLPTGLYVRTEPLSLDFALDFVKFAADLTGFQNCGVIMSPEGSRSFGLKVRPLTAPAYTQSFLRERLARRLHP